MSSLTGHHPKTHTKLPRPSLQPHTHETPQLSKSLSTIRVKPQNGSFNLGLRGQQSFPIASVEPYIVQGAVDGSGGAPSIDHQLEPQGTRTG